MEQQTQIILIIAGVIVLIIFICSCWDTIEPTQYGLLCNSISKQCDKTEIYESGRHLVGPLNYFISFPGSLQTIQFADKAANAPLQTRTAEGLSLSLSLSFQYQLIKAEIPDLYSMNNLQYESTFIRIARDIILQAAGGFDAPSYWTKRADIGVQMQNQLDKELKNAHTRCVYLQILKIDLPDPYEQSIVETQVEVQKKQMKQFEQEATMIQKEIDVLTSDTERQIKGINAQAQADAYNIKQKAMADAAQLIINSEAQAYSQAKNLTGLSSNELNEYIYYLSLMEKDDSKLLVGVNEVIAMT